MLNSSFVEFVILEFDQYPMTYQRICYEIHVNFECSTLRHFQSLNSPLKEEKMEYNNLILNKINGTLKTSLKKVHITLVSNA